MPELIDDLGIFDKNKAPQSTIQVSNLKDDLGIFNESQQIANYIRKHEGISKEVYPDTSGNKTFGIGHKVLPGEDTKTMDIEQTFLDDVNKHIGIARKLFPNFNTYPIDVKKALADGIFRGEYKVGQKTVDYINSGQWDKVPDEYINRDDYRKSKDPKNKQGGIYKRMNENAEIFRVYGDSLRNKPQKTSFNFNPFSPTNAFAEEPDNGNMPPDQDSVVKLKDKLVDDIGIYKQEKSSWVREGIKGTVADITALPYRLLGVRAPSEGVVFSNAQSINEWLSEPIAQREEVIKGSYTPEAGWKKQSVPISRGEALTVAGINIAGLALLAKGGYDELRNLIQSPAIQYRLNQLVTEGRGVIWRGQKFLGMKPQAALVPVEESDIANAVASGRMSFYDAARFSPSFKTQQTAIRQPGTSEALAEEARIRQQFRSAYETYPRAGGLPAGQGLTQLNQYLSNKGITMTGVGNIVRMTQDMTVKDVFGNKITLPAKEEYREYKLSNNHVLLHDGKNLIVNKNQLENVENQNLILGEKEFAPEVKARLVGSMPYAGGKGAKPPAKPPETAISGAPKEPEGEPIDPAEKLIQVLKDAKSVRNRQEALYTKERAARFAKAKAIGEKITGEKGFYAELGALKGQFDKVEFESIKTKLSQSLIDNLFLQIKNSENLTYLETFPARTGLAKLFGEFGGQVPTRSELELLNRVFPPELTQTLLDKRHLFTKFGEALNQIANIPRSIMASFDLSFGFRQGIFMLGYAPNKFFSGFLRQFKYFGSEKAYQELLESIRANPNFELAQKSGLALTEMGKVLATREERFMAPWAERITVIGHGVRASGRAYTGFANKLRFDVFCDLVNQAKKLGLNPQENLDLTKGIANFVNECTGRGGLGKLERAAVVLNTWFFSPRLWASRLSLLSKPFNPNFYIKEQPFVRKQYLKALLAFAGMVVTITSLAKLKGAKVTTDFRNPDAGKIRIGNTRIDFMGGFQQNIRAAAQLITGQYVSSLTGRVMTLGEGYKPLNRLDIILRQIEYKQAPVFSFITDLLKGTDVEGKPLSIPKEVGKRFIPMVISDLYDIIKEEPKTIPLWPLSVFGVGLQTYGGDKKTQELLTILGGVAEKRATITKRAEKLLSGWEQELQLTEREIFQRAIEIKKTDKELYEELKEIHKEKKLGITEQERLIKRLPTELGIRAKFIYKELNNLSTNAEKIDYLNGLSKKGIITDEVKRQIKFLIKKGS